MNEQNQEQQLQNQVIALKARLFDAQENIQQMNDFVGKVAQKVSFEGQSIEELLERIPPVAKPQSEGE